ncbi:unnamed protein product [Protopolystoma xenopodis]|uniref:Uncharacterized protein n=1 Tax=Protopolystoma xenopodis TaxID=117903 RepID=A0A3S5AI33_9PLAT|nr:unnamed protein product [Protopolystoma xenopodis]
MEEDSKLFSQRLEAFNLNMELERQKEETVLQEVTSKYKELEAEVKKKRQTLDISVTNLTELSQKNYELDSYLDQVSLELETFNINFQRFVDAHSNHKNGIENLCKTIKEEILSAFHASLDLAKEAGVDL